MTAVCKTRRVALLLALSLIFIAWPAATNAGAQEGQAAAVQMGVDTDFSCYQCHSKPEITPWITATWLKSKHASSGVKCSDCHGTHDEGFDSPDFTPLPGPQVCNKCHPINVKETIASAHANVVKCTSCHPRHTFSLDVARNPKICSSCHSGDKHVDGYANSKMGVIYSTEGPGSAATCQSCHMPGGTHNVNQTIDNKDQMLKVCNKCHSASFAGEVLKSGRLGAHW